jgi:hypothetical protein
MATSLGAVQARAMENERVSICWSLHMSQTPFLGEIF